MVFNLTNIDGEEQISFSLESKIRLDMAMSVVYSTDEVKTSGDTTCFCEISADKLHTYKTKEAADEALRILNEVVDKSDLEKLIA